MLGSACLRPLGDRGTGERGVGDRRMGWRGYRGTGNLAVSKHFPSSWVSYLNISLYLLAAFGSKNMSVKHGEKDNQWQPPPQKKEINALSIMSVACLCPCLRVTESMGGAGGAGGTGGSGKAWMLQVEPRLQPLGSTGIIISTLEFPLALHMLVTCYRKCGLLFHPVCVCACVLHMWRQCRNTELGCLKPHHNSNCEAQIDCSVATETITHACDGWECVLYTMRTRTS